METRVCGTKSPGTWLNLNGAEEISWGTIHSPRMSASSKTICIGTGTVHYAGLPKMETQRACKVRCMEKDSSMCKKNLWGVIFRKSDSTGHLRSKIPRLHNCQVSVGRLEGPWGDGQISQTSILWAPVHISGLVKTFGRQLCQTRRCPSFKDKRIGIFHKIAANQTGFH